jgi:hypothetical protein
VGVCPSVHLSVCMAVLHDPISSACLPFCLSVYLPALCCRLSASLSVGLMGPVCLPVTNCPLMCPFLSDREPFVADRLSSVLWYVCLSVQQGALRRCLTNRAAAAAAAGHSGAQVDASLISIGAGQCSHTLFFRPLPGGGPMHEPYAMCFFMPLPARRGRWGRGSALHMFSLCPC